MPIQGSSSLHPGAQPATHLLQSGQHRRGGNAIDLQRELSLRPGLHFLDRAAEQKRSISYRGDTGKIFQRS